MKAKRVFMIVWLVLFAIIFGYGMYYISTQGLSMAMIEQGVAIYVVYAGGVAAIVAAITAGIFRVVTRGKKPGPGAQGP